MSLKEITVAGFWVASAIGVAGWTWQAYTQQYSKFPAPGDAPGTSSFDWNGLLFGPAAPIAKAVEGAVGAIGSGLSTAPKAIKAKGGPGTLGAPPGVQPHPGR